MILQIPVQGGYQGGNLVVWHSHAKKKFNFGQESSQKFFLTAFYADCYNQLEPVTDGWLLTLVFNLVWKYPMPIIREPRDVPMILKVIKEIKQSIPACSSTNDDVDLPVISSGTIKFICFAMKMCYNTTLTIFLT